MLIKILVAPSAVLAFFFAAVGVLFVLVPGVDAKRLRQKEERAANGFAAQVGADRSSGKAGEGAFYYDYQKHGTDWVDGRCTSRERQSPIDFMPGVLTLPLTSPNFASKGNFTFQYQVQKSSFEVQNTGHGLAADFSGTGLGGINYNGAWYSLLNVNIHAASEHTYGHLHYPLEVHFVHKKFDNTDFLVVAIPVRSLSVGLAYVPTTTLTLEEENKVRGLPPAAFLGKNATLRTANLKSDEASFAALSPGAPRPVIENAEDQLAKVRAFVIAENERRLRAERSNATKGSAQTKDQTQQSLGAAVPAPAPMGPAAPGVGANGPAVFPEPLYLPPGMAELYWNPFLQFFLKRPPPKMNQRLTAEVNAFSRLDLNPWLFGGSYLEYAGSLTSPPCAEIANWLVRREPIWASDSQVLLLHEAIYGTTAGLGNYRAAMPVNGRVIGIKTAVKEEPPPLVTPPPGMSFPTPTPFPVDRAGRAMQPAVEALKMAKASTDYMANLDGRLQKAAKAHAAIANKPLGTPTVFTPPAPVYGSAVPLDIAATAHQIAGEVSIAKDRSIAEKVGQIGLEKQEAALREAAEAAAAAAGSAPAPAGPVAPPPA